VKSTTLENCIPLAANEIAFGPVPSRRLGKSLGINNIPPKICSYSCIYCQLGTTPKKIATRQPFYRSNELFEAVRRKVDNVKTRNERIDYLTFVSDGEPTLDSNLGEEITRLRQLRLPIAVITNASMLWQKDVTRDLLKADYVSIKVDAISEHLWNTLDRPHRDLRLTVILDGIRDFADIFEGTLTSETMLIDNVDYGNEFEGIAGFLSKLKKLNRAYIAVPTRPPTEKWVKPAQDAILSLAFKIFSEQLGIERTELLTRYEGNEFAPTGDVEEDLLSIMAVHPMRDQAVREFLRKTNTSWQIIDELLIEEKIVELELEGGKYYLKKLASVVERK